MRRAIKGNFGYIHNKRIQVLIRTILFFGISLAVFLVGYLTTHTKQNLLTIVAVLGCLPACKSMVGLIMIFRATGCSEKAREAIQPAEGRLIGMYDMYFTSYQKNFAISHMVVEGKVILGYTEDPKCDLKACQEHLHTMLSQAGFQDRVVKISDQLPKYCEQLQKLNASEDKNDEESLKKDDEVRVVLYDISL